MSVCNLLRSLIKQICIGESVLPAAVLNMGATYKASGHQPNTKVLVSTLHSAIDSLRKKTYLVIDALDEVPEAKRHELLSVIKLLRGSEHSDVHILLTSRRELDIERALTSIATSNIATESSQVDDDIKMYIRARLAEDSRLCRLPKSVKEAIEVRLGSRAHGMFRWAVCQLDTLRACNKVSAIKKSLEELPDTLDATYARILRAIEPADTSEAYRILQWLAFAERPLSLEEVAEAAVTNDNGSVVDPEDRLFDPYDITNTEEELPPSMPSMPLWDYAAEFWFRHLRWFRICTGTTEPFNPLVAELFMGSALVFRNWVSTYNVDTRRSSSASPVLRPLYYAAFLGLSDAVRMLLDSGVNVDAYGGKFGTALIAAASQGHEDVVEILLEYKASVDARGASVFSTALQASCYYGFLQVTKILLDNGAQPDRKREKDDTALELACEGGHKAIVELLIERGSDVNLLAGGYGYPLSAASERGYPEIVSLLLRNGAKVNNKGGIYCTALQAAASAGSEDIVRLLLASGADVNVQGGMFDDALRAAALRRHPVVMELLYVHGASVKPLTQTLLDSRDIYLFVQEHEDLTRRYGNLNDYNLSELARALQSANDDPSTQLLLMLTMLAVERLAHIRSHELRLLGPTAKRQPNLVLVRKLLKYGTDEAKQSALWS
ncbi:MAG: hypothetical protein Q9218_004630 [Villophora microphyllina]